LRVSNIIRRPDPHVLSHKPPAEHQVKCPQNATSNFPKDFLSHLLIPIAFADFLYMLICNIRHTFWNGQIDEIRSFVLCGLWRRFSETFWSGASKRIQEPRFLEDGRPLM
jgi:hypothetical protein